MRWSKAMPCKNEDQEVVIKMIKQLMTHFDIPHTIISDNRTTLIGVNLLEFIIEYEIYW